MVSDRGGILSPQLFSVYMDSLSEALCDSSVGCFYNHKCVNHLFYADDAVLLAPTASSLQKLIDICYEYSLDNDITYNVKKSLCMTVVPQCYKDLHIPSLCIGGKLLKTTPEHKYLGVFVRHNGIDDTDISRQIRATYIQGNIIIHKFKLCCDNVKTQLFKSYCFNMYGCQLWANFSKMTLVKLQTAFNNVFRGLMNIDRMSSISAAFIKYNVHHFKVLQRRIILGFRTRILNNDNDIVRTIVRNPFLFIRVHYLDTGGKYYIKQPLRLMYSFCFIFLFFNK